MSSPARQSALLARESYVDWDDLSGLDKIVAIYQVGDSCVVVETNEGREIRITAWLDRGRRQYVADFERRSAMPGAGPLKVWAHTPAYPRCVADDLLGCLEAAILAVDRVPVY
jgi:hypothetical protein